MELTRTLSAELLLIGGFAFVLPPSES